MAIAAALSRFNQRTMSQGVSVPLHGRYDVLMLLAMLALAGLGVVMVASATVAQTTDPFYYLKRHVVFVALAAVAAVVAMRVDLKWLEKHNRWFMVGTFVLLLLVFLPGIGVSRKGATRWINLGVSNFQVVEVAKLFFIIWLSSYLVRFGDAVYATWGALLKPILLYFLVAALLVLQPDLGSAALIGGVVFAMLVLAGAQLPRMATPAFLIGLAVVILVIVEPYRMRRLISFMDPWKTAFDEGYQLANALMAIGRGGFGGVGLGDSVLKLQYLPEAHTDFIMAVIAEELGFVGVCVVMALFVLLVGRALWLGYRCLANGRRFSGYLALGIGLMVGIQALISIGVNLGAMPTKGLTLPLISYGGSSIVATGLAMGLLLRISYEFERSRRVAMRRQAAVKAAGTQFDGNAAADIGSVRNGWGRP